jgi:hypothetical protein
VTWSDPVDATANVTGVTAAREKTYVLDNLRAIAEWTTYTPTITQSGTVTKTTTYCKYRSFGGTVEIQAFLTITGSGTGGNAILISLPFTSATSTGLVVGSGLVSDTGTANYPVLAVINTTTTIKFFRSDQGPAGDVGVDPNFSLANTDVIRFHAVYEQV